MTILWKACYGSTNPQGEATRTAILEAILETPGSTMEAIATATGLTYFQVRRQCPRLSEAGLICAQPQGRTKHYYPATRP